MTGEQAPLPPSLAGSRLGELVRALAEDWPAVLAALQEPERRQLVALLDEAGGGNAEAILVAVEDVLMLADLPDDHPVAVYLTGRDRFEPGSGPDLGQTRLALGWLRDAVSLVESEPVPRAGDPAESPSPVPRESVYRRLAAVPAYSPEELADAGGDPERRELIRLRLGSQVRLPRFQFEPGGAPRDVVLEVNRVLDAENDPWGVTSWWLDWHAWLAGLPVDLLDGTAEQQRQLGAAAAAEVAD
jgi:hypothetical protein